MFTVLVLVWILGLLLVGRKGAPRGAVIVVEVVVEGVEEVLGEEEVVDDEVDEARHKLPDPHSRSVRQHPPPSETGQALKPLEQGRVVCGPLTTAVLAAETSRVGVDEMELEEDEVLLGMLVVEEVVKEVVVVEEVDVVEGEEVDGGDNVVVTIGVTTTTDIREGPGPPID